MIKGVAKKHSKHQMELRKGTGPHAFKLWCKQCNKHVQWINNAQAIKIRRIK